MVAGTVVALAVVAAAAGGAGTFALSESRTGKNASLRTSLAPVSGPARLAFSHAGAIWTIKPDGSDRRRIVAGADPAWSPDGQLLAFVRERDRRGTIWVAAPDGSGARQVAADLEATLGDPAWSPDASQLAFSRLKFGESAETSIDVIRLDGSARRAVISQPLHQTLDVASQPVWMPDGRGIAYTRATHVLDGKYRFDIRVVNVDGGGDRVFLKSATGGAWSPDGRRFAYGDTRKVAGDVCGHDECFPAADIAIAEADGSDRKVLLRTATDENDPSWSGDGTRIAFSSGRNLPDRRFPPDEIYSMAADGTCLTWLTNGTPASQSPSWSPADGSAAAPWCGAAGRPARVDVRPRRSHARALWLGPRFGRSLLDLVQGKGRNTIFHYGDCSSYEPPDCPREFLLDGHDSCKRIPEWPRFVLRSLKNVRRVRGALIATRGNDHRSVLIAGRNWLHVQLETIDRPSAQLMRNIVVALRPVGGRRPERFPRPIIPSEFHRYLPASIRGSLRGCPSE